MTVPILSTRAAHVELTPKRRDFLKAKLFPLCRYAPDASVAYFDVVVRQNHTRSAGDQVSVSIKLTVDTDQYISVSVAKKLEVAVSEARSALKRQLRDRKSVKRRISPWWHQPVQVA